MACGALYGNMRGVMSLSSKLDNVFSKIPPQARYAKISDFALRVYAEIYAHNYMGSYKITNKTIAAAFNRSKVSVSRAIAELLAAELIIVKGDRVDRYIETIKTEEKTISYDPELSETLKDAFKW
jgi:DNA-binding MarR family transcriptional regulator